MWQSLSSKFEGSRKMSIKPTKMMWKRMITVVLLITLIMFTVSGVQLTNIMIVKGDFYKEKASQQQLYDTETTALRGDIYDCNMNLLATSATVWNVYVTPNDFKSAYDNDKQRMETAKSKIATGLSEILSLKSEDLLEDLNQKSSYVIIKRNIEKQLADKVRKFISDGQFGDVIGLDESSKRYYPNESLASTVLGFVGSDNQGLYGVELSYNTQLTGTPGRVVASKNAQGSDMKFSYEYVEKAKKGNTLILTLDTYIQEVAEKYLDEAVVENKVADRGTCVVMNVKTGAILAMAVSGDFNPNKPFELSSKYKTQLKGLSGSKYKKKKAELQNKMWRNKAVSDAYEPGSVFKILTCAAALEEGITTPTTSYNCSGQITVAGNTYHCHLTTGHGTQTLSQAMQNSCNPVFISLGSMLGVKTFSKYFNAFGLTEKTGIDLPGEASSSYHSEKNMGPVELASSAFGQTFKITPIQLLTAVSATVNGGYLVQPHVVSEVRDADNKTVSTTGTVHKRQVVSKNTSETISELLYEVVELGGGKNAHVAGYKIGGKTGTSQKVAENLSASKTNLYVGSFLGVAPADDPEIAILFLLDEPMGDNYYGGTISAPPGGKILSEVLPYLGYEPHYSEEELKSMSKNVDNVTGEKVSSATSTLSAKGFKAKVVGDGDTVQSQMPEAGSKIYDGGVVVLYTGGKKSTTAKVPDFTGMTVSAVNEAATNAGFNVSFEGASLTASGVTAYSQSEKKGTKLPLGTTITVYFRDNTTVDFSAQG